MTALYEYRVEYEDEAIDDELVETDLPPEAAFFELAISVPDEPAVKRVVYVGRVA